MAEQEWRIRVPSAAARQVRERGGAPEQQLVLKLDYPTRHLPDAIDNLHVLLPVLGDGPLDFTAFYSRSWPLTPQQLKEREEIDLLAQEAARKSGGLRLYKPGMQIPNPDMLRVDPALGLTWNPDAMSFCGWDSPEQARSGSSTPEHQQAWKKTPEWYQHVGVKKYDAWVERGAGAEIIVFRSKPLVRAVAA